MKKTLWISATVLILVLLICAGIGDARYNDGSTYSIARGINYTDNPNTVEVVFIGEQNLNFSQFRDKGGYTQLAKEGSSDETKKIEIGKDGLVTIDSKFEEGYYYPYNASISTVNMSGSSVWIVNPTTVFGEIGFATRSTKKEPTRLTGAQDTTVSALSTILYGVKGTNSERTEIIAAINQILNLSKAKGDNWKVFDFLITITDANSPEDTILRRVVNSSGFFDFSENNPIYPETIDYNASGFFTYSNSENRGNHKFPLTVTIDFVIADDSSSKQGLNGLNIKLTATQTISETLTYTMLPNPIEITEGGFVDLTLRGVPYQTYQLSIIPNDGNIYLGTADNPHSEIEVTPTKTTYSVDDDQNMRLRAREGVDDNNQYSLIVNVVDPDEPTLQIYSQSFPITVRENVHKPTLEVSEAAKTGQFSVGDIIRVSWNYEGTPYVENTGDVENGTLYLEGMNFPKKKLDTVTFTDPVKLFYLDTTGLDAGTYTLSLAGKEHTAEVAIYLSTPLLTASLSGGSQGTVVQGSKLRLDWNARGSPFANYTTNTTNHIISSLSPNLYEGQIQWYIFGQNFAAAYDSHFSLVNGALGRDVPNGEGRYTYNRSFTKSLDPGTYYVIVQHPGADKYYSIAPEKTADGLHIQYPLANVNVYGDASRNKTGTLNVANKQAANAAEMIRTALESGTSDDLYVQLQFQIEAPWFSITELKGGKIGDTLSLYGETNYPSGENVSLTITPVSFTPQKAENSQMQMTAYYESKIVDSQSYNRRTFVIDGISTTNWYPGTYVGTFKMKDTNEDTGIVKNMSFVVGPNGVITTPDITIIENTVSTPTSIATPVENVQSTATSTTTPATNPTSTKKSPAPLAGIIIGLAVTVALGMVKSRR